MTEAIATLVVRIVGLYLAAGSVFGIAFVLFGVGRLDPVARQGTWGFRVLILPGTIALWPLLAWRWIRGSKAPPGEHNAHRDAAGQAGRGQDL